MGLVVVVLRGRGATEPRRPRCVTASSAARRAEMDGVLSSAGRTARQRSRCGGVKLVRNSSKTTSGLLGCCVVGAVGRFLQSAGSPRIWGFLRQNRNRKDGCTDVCAGRVSDRSRWYNDSSLSYDRCARSHGNSDEPLYTRQKVG